MFGEQVRAARLERRLSEAQLARQAGISRSQLRDLERDRNVSVATLLKITAQLPNLTHLRLYPGEPPKTVDAQAVSEAAAQLASALRKLRILTGEESPGGGVVEAGDVHQTASSLPPADDLRFREIEASIREGTPDVESDL